MDNTKDQVHALNLIASGLAIISQILAFSTIIVLCCWIWQDLDYDLGKILIICLILTLFLSWFYKQASQLLLHKELNVKHHHEPMSLSFLIEIRRAIPNNRENIDLLKRLNLYEKNLFKLISENPPQNT